MKSYIYKKYSAWMMAIVFLFSLVAQAQAAPTGMISSEQLARQSLVAEQRAAVSGFLDRSDVQAQLAARGVDVADAQARVQNMTAAELATVSSQIDELPAGEGVLETVLFLLVVFMLLDIAGVTDIFPGL